MNTQSLDTAVLSHCPKCLYPLDHPLGLTMVGDECSGCFTHHEKDLIDWQSKKIELEELLKKYKKYGRGYDCVVPVVGDAEDFYIVSKVLELGLSPLIVSVNDYFKNDIGWHNLHHLITHFDVDSISYNPDITTYKELIRTSLRKFDHVRLPFLQLHTAFPVHVAKARNIPLVIWGQNQAVEQVGKFSHLDRVEMSSWSRNEHDLFNTPIEKLIGNGAQVDNRKLNYYKYPQVSALKKSNVKGVYLSNYFSWDPLRQNNSVIEYGFKPQKQSSTFDVYERAGNSVYYELNDLLKLKKIGYRKSSDHIAREIRHGRLTINDGEELNKVYAESSVYIKSFFDWLNVTESGYQWFIKHRLQGFSHLIAKSVVEQYDNQKETVNSLSGIDLLGESSLRDFVLFGKGV